MLINQARNLASLPYSSLQQLEQSIQRTQQLLAQAQRIAYDVQQIDRAFSTTYAPASSSQSRSGADRAMRRRAGRTRSPACRMPCACRPRVVGNLDTNRTQMSALVTVKPGRDRRAAGEPGRQSAPRACRRSSSPISRQPLPRKGGRKISKLPSAASAQDQGREQLRRFLDARSGLSALNRADVSLMSAVRTFRRLPLIAAVGARGPGRRSLRNPASRRRGQRHRRRRTRADRSACAELERCRTVTSEQIGRLSGVPSRFGRRTAVASSVAESASVLPSMLHQGSRSSVPRPKDPSRLPQGYRPLQHPNSE